MERYFNINYEFGRQEVVRRIDETLARDEHGYIPVADMVVVGFAQRNARYRKVIDGAMFAISDSSWAPLFLKWIYGHEFRSYTGASIFRDLVTSRRYRMAFLGTDTKTLETLREKVAATMNPDVKDMLMYELPFCHVDEFDYPAIAKMVEEDGADIIWVALGAPKQEIFMSRLNEHLSRGVQIAVGAVFKFYSGLAEKRAPEWMRKHRLEFLYRIYQDPKKQLKRCFGVIRTLPRMLFGEWKRKKRG